MDSGFGTRGTGVIQISDSWSQKGVFESPKRALILKASPESRTTYPEPRACYYSNSITSLNPLKRISWIARAPLAPAL
jgi:hypothetical protein